MLFSFTDALRMFPPAIDYIRSNRFKCSKVKTDYELIHFLVSIDPRQSASINKVLLS